MAASWRSSKRGHGDRGAANQTPGLAGVFTTFNTQTPKVYADIDRVRAEMLGVNTNDVFQTLEVYLGSQYVNDFNFLGRTYRVTAQADGNFRQDLHAIGNLKTRNAKGRDGAARLGRLVPRHHRSLPGRAFQPVPVGRGARRHAAWLLDRLWARRHGEDREGSCRTVIPSSWTELAYQEKLAGNTAIFVFWPRWSSSSCCSPRNMRAGLCRSR